MTQRPLVAYPRPARRVIGLLIAAFTVGCRSESSGESAPDPEPASALFRVALLHPGRETDRGWNQLAYEALMTLGARPGVAVRHTHTPNRSNFKADMRAYAEQRFDQVICHGGEFLKAAKQVASQYPHTRFLVTGIDEAGDGVATLDFRLWEAAYLCGVLAARIAPGGPAGLIGGEDFRTVRYTLEAFANGARSVEPEYATYTQYIGSWDDVARAAQTATSLIDGYKARVLFQNADAAAFGEFQAARDANVNAFGANRDQNGAAPEHVPASAVIDMALAFAQAADGVRSGAFRDETVVHDLKSGGIKFVPNPRLMKAWPEGTQELLNNVEERIKRGEIDVLSRGGY